MKNLILVTGGAGYIGSHTVVEFQNVGLNSIIVDNLSNSHPTVLSGIKQITNVDPIFKLVDVTDKQKLEKVFAEFGHEILGVIHFAALKYVGESVEKPLEYYGTNINSILNVLSLMRKYKVRNFVFSSSCTVYGQPDTLPVTETSPRKKAVSPYGNTKAICEDIIADTVKLGDIKAVILRYFNPIGAHESALIGENPKQPPLNIMPIITQTAKGLRPSLSVFGNDYNTSDGTCVRDYIHVVDLAKAHVKAMQRLSDNKTSENLEIFNVGTGNGFTVLELIHSFEKVNGIKLNYNITGRRDGDIEAVWADTTHANNVLGWKAQLSVDDMMRSAWKWELNLNK